MKNVNDVFDKVSIPSKEIVNKDGKKVTVDVAGAKAQPVANFLDAVKTNDYKMIKKTVMNKLGNKRTVWVKKFIDNKTASTSAYG